MKPLHGIKPEKQRKPRLTRGIIQKLYYAINELEVSNIILRQYSNRSLVYADGESVQVPRTRQWASPYWLMSKYSDSYVDWNKVHIVFKDM